jgi:nucleoside-diphosphate-sugar epimerase
VLVSRREADISRAAATIGWKPQISVSEGIEEIVRLERGA